MKNIIKSTVIFLIDNKNIYEHAKIVYEKIFMNMQKLFRVS